MNYSAYCKSALASRVLNRKFYCLANAFKAWFISLLAIIFLTACGHTKLDKTGAGYDEYRKIRHTVNQELADKKLPEHVEGVSGILDKELTWLASLDYGWHSQLLKQSKVVDGVLHWKYKCKGVWPKDMPSILLRHRKSISGLVINLIDIDLDANPKLKLQPVIAANNSKYNYRQPLIGIANDSISQGKNVLAGINGGYFFIPPESITKPFLDSNCLSNFYLNFERPPYSSHQIGDGLLVINKQAYSYNCQTIGPFSPSRTSFIQNKNGTYQINEVVSGKFDIGTINNALGAGPGLISAGKIAIKAELIPSTLEFSANTALVLGQGEDGHKHAVLFTVDGSDGNHGMYSFEMANYLARQLPGLIRVIPVDAMSMDQGGSTGMVVKENGKLNTVSNSGDKNRPIYNALLLEE